MNARIDRLRFSAARGMVMPADEHALARRRGPLRRARNASVHASHDSGTSLWFAVRAIAFAALCAFGMQPVVVEAQATLPMAPDRRSANHPVVGVSASGVPLANIVAPNGAGVSLNNFTHYNVGTKGAVIVNTPRSAQTQIAGWVQGNPLMGNAPARLIINQVTSGNPTRLLGSTEIAGDRANLVIANPAGITCAGCGFINVPRVSLATARPAFDADGSLAGFDVTHGNLGVAGAGLDARGSAIDLIARAMQINGQVWAQSIQATAGANHVSYLDGTAAAQGGEGEKPGVAIDVQALGGMYANSVRLIGTEAGVGVRHSGIVNSLTGDIQLSANGDVIIERAARIQAAGELSVGAPNVKNEGAVAGRQAVRLKADATLQNEGLIGALSNADLMAHDVINSGDIFAGVESSGAVAGPGSVTLTGVNVSSRGMLVAGDNVNVTGTTVSLDRSAAYAASALNVQGSRSLTTRGAGGSALNATLLSDGTFINDGGTFDTVGDTMVDARSISNRGGRLSGRMLTITAAGDVENTGGNLVALGHVHVSAMGLTNDARGLVVSGGNLKFDARRLRNAGGAIRAASAQIEVGSLDNTNGLLGTSVGKLSVSNDGVLSNDNGVILGAEGLELKAQRLSANADGKIATYAGDTKLSFAEDAGNAHGVISSAGKLTMTGQNLDNTSGHIGAAAARVSTVALTNTDGEISARVGSMEIEAQTASSNAGGTLRATDTLTMRAERIDNALGKVLGNSVDLAANRDLKNEDGRIISGHKTNVAAETVSNHQGMIGTVKGPLTLATTGTTDNAQGKLLAGGDLNLTSATLTNSRGVVSGDNVSLKSGAGRIDNTRGVIDAFARLETDSGALDNRSGLIQSGESAHLNTHVGVFDNRVVAGSEVGGRAVGNGVTLTADDVQNTAGLIYSSDETRVDASSLTNDYGAIVSHAALSVESVNAVSNLAGYIGGHAQVMLKGASIDNTRGAVHAKQSLTVTGDAIVNATTKDATVAPMSSLTPLPAGMEGSTVSLTATAHIDNAAGAIRSDQETQLGAQTIANSDGAISSSGRVVLTADKQVTNTRGDINGARQLEVSTGALDNGGRMQSLDGVTIKTRDGLTNNGTIIAGRDLEVRAQGKVANGRTMTARNDASVLAQHIDNGQGGEIWGNHATHIHAKQSLSNKGLIDGGAALIEAADTLTNLGRIYGDSVSLDTQLLRNHADTGGVGGAIASRGGLDIGAKVIENEGGSLIYASKDIRTARNLNANGRASDVLSDRLKNNGSQLDAGGDIEIAAVRFENLNANFRTEKVTTDSGRQIWYTVPGSTARLDPSDVYFYQRNSQETRMGEAYAWALDDDQKRLLLPSARYPFAEYAKYTMNGVAGKIDEVRYRAAPRWVGNNATVERDVDLVGVFRAVSEDMWARFGVAPPPDPSYIKPGNYTVTVPLLRQRELGSGWYSLNVPIAQSQGQGGDSMPKLETCLTVAADQCGSFNQWYGKLTDAYTSLAGAVKDYNDDVESRAVDRWTIYDVNVKSTKDVVTATQPGRITAGGKITINSKSGINDKSQILAGGRAYLNDAIQDNSQPRGTETFIGSGRAISTWVENAGGFSGEERKQTSQAYAAPFPSREIVLSIAGVTTSNQDPVKRVAADASTARGVSSAQLNGAEMQPIGGLRGADHGTAALRDRAAMELERAVVDKGAQASAIARAKLGAVEIRTVEPNVKLPNNALYQAVSDPGSRYLIETDPRFTNHKSWLSSDGMIAALSMAPGSVQKRLADGFYEQQLVQQQIIEATGQRFIGNYDDNQTQYQALMANGVKAAKRFNMNVGTALTDAQMAALTNDIVWLVNREVALPDGTQQTVLVPQVYLRANAADVTGTGSIVAGESVALNNDGALANSGTISSRRLTIITADSITNLGTISGEKVRAEAKEDLNSFGGLIQGHAVSLAAGRDVNVSSTTSSATTANGSATAIDRPATINSGTLEVWAGRDLNTEAAQIASTGDALLAAARDVNINAIRQSSEDHVQWGEKNRAARSASIDSGTEVVSGGSIGIVAGRDLNATAASVSALGALSALAARDVNLNAGEQSASAYDEHNVKESGVFSSKSMHSIDSRSYTDAIGTTLSGDTVNVSAGQNLTARAATIAGTGDVNLEAGKHLRVTTADTASSEYHFKDVKKSGLGSAGAGISYGSNQTTDSSRDRSRGARGSLIGSIEGSVSLRAGEKLHITGSTVVASRDVMGVAKQVKIDAARTNRHHEETHEMKSSGFTLAVKSPVIDAIQNVNQQARGAASSQDGRAAALHAIAAGGGTADLVGATGNMMDAINSNQKPEAKIELSFGSSRSKTTFTEQATQSDGSVVRAGGRASFVATGEKGAGQGNVTIEGSAVMARDVLLQATDRVNVVSSSDTASTRSTNESASASVGMSFGTNGWGVSAAMSRAHGDANSDAVTHNNSHIKAGNSAIIISGGDTNIVGANVNAAKVMADIGGNLNIASVQDTSRSAARQSSVGGGFSVSQGGGSASFSMKNGRASGSYAGVHEQSGIQAGDGGFDIRVKGNTDLKGAYIASTAEPERNYLTTGTLSFSDIRNSSSYRASSTGISAGGGFGDGGNNYATHGETAGKNAGGASPMSVSESGRNDAFTRSAISTGRILITDAEKQTQNIAMLNRDAVELNGTVNKLPDLQDVLGNQSDLIEASQAAAETVAKQVGRYAETKQRQAQKAADIATDSTLKAQFEQEAKDWAEGGDSRVALHVVGGALTGGLSGGGLGGAVGAGLSAKLAPKFDGLAHSIKEAGPTGHRDVDQLLGNLASNVLAGSAGALVGGPTGALTSAATDRFNRQLHEEDREQGKRLAALSKAKGLSYTEGDIANQQALMDLTVGGKNYYGENQVATGEKPQDGTDWSYYGQNVKGEPVWAQSVQRGDPDLQAFIANNTNGKTANGMTYEATTIGKSPGLFRMPDFVNFQVDYFVGSVWGTFTREGKSYFGYGTNMALPNPVQASTSITAGWLNKSSVAPGQVDDFMKGYAGGATGAYGLVGGGMMYSPGNGAATLIGIGGGVSAAKAPNVGGVGGGYTVEQGKTRMEW